MGGIYFWSRLGGTSDRYTDCELQSVRSGSGSGKVGSVCRAALTASLSPLAVLHLGPPWALTSGDAEAATSAATGSTCLASSFLGYRLPVRQRERDLRTSSESVLTLVKKLISRRLPQVEGSRTRISFGNRCSFALPHSLISEGSGMSPHYSFKM